MTSMNEDFAAFILTHGRPDNVITYDTLRRQGYTGRIVIVVDNTDKTVEAYKERFGDQVVVFDKAAVARTFDTADNSDDMRTIVYARNASYDIARDLGLKYFVQLDDDYVHFEWRYDSDLKYVFMPGEGAGRWFIHSLDKVFDALLTFIKETPSLTVALAQGGDFIGGHLSSSTKLTLKRKAMNSFFCDVDKPVRFVGRINEDVNVYTRGSSVGELLFTATHVALVQKATQTNKGGMTDVYKLSGTYVKSFYSVMYHPSSVTVQMMGSTHPRLHHQVNWKATAPKILSPRWRKEA